MGQMSEGPPGYMRGTPSGSCCLPRQLAAQGSSKTSPALEVARASKITTCATAEHEPQSQLETTSTGACTHPAQPITASDVPAQHTTVPANQRPHRKDRP
jgi:hypothetical protein